MKSMESGVDCLCIVDLVHCCPKICVKDQRD